MNAELLDILHNVGIMPKDKTLYVTAFIHRSYLNEVKQNISSNERLEFLGDSVLSLIVSKALFSSRGTDSEGDLTNLRAYIVKTESLAKAASKLKLGTFLKLSRGEEVSGGRNNTQILANTFEALLGAIYLDQGFDSADQFVKATLLPLFATVLKDGAPKDPKSVLQEKAQSLLKTSPKYKIIATEGPDHAKIFTVGVFLEGRMSGEGRGSSKQHAEEEAAKEALAKLETQD